jgi:outer membrane lipoprotein-sorting protein
MRPAGRILALLLVLATASGLHGRSRAASGDRPRVPGPDIAAFATNVDDIELTAIIEKLDSAELEKIGRDFSFSYRLKSITFQYKSPDRVRFAGRVPALGEAVVIINGPTRLFKIPRMRQRIEDLKLSPSRRLTLLEYGGIVSQDTLRFMQGKFLRQEPLDGADTSVYELRYRGVTSGSYYRVWIDPRTRLTAKREWFDSENRLKATFRYLDPRQVGSGVWLPETVEVDNAEGKVGAVTRLDAVRINQGLSDALFRVGTQ